MNEHFVSNKDESVRMFPDDRVERLTHVHPASPHVVYIPVAVWLLWHATTTRSMTLLMLLFGFLFWTGVEYLLHRYLFHAPDHVMQETHDTVARLGPGEAVIPALQTWRHIVYFIMHGVHHEYPNDSSRLVLPPLATLPLAAAFYFAFRLVLGAAAGPIAFTGFLIGYLIYDTMHFLVHHRVLPTSVGRYIKWRHNHHHFVDPDRDYGVSTPLWDVFMGTLSRRTDATKTA